MKKLVVENLVKKYNSDEMKAERFRGQVARLEKLINKYGLEKTAFAAGLELSTLLVYLRSRKYISISDKCIDQAEWVFNNYSE